MVTIKNFEKSSFVIIHITEKPCTAGLFLALIAVFIS